MATLADLQKYRSRLEAARYSGTREVEDQNGERIAYRSEAEVARALAAVSRAIAEAEAGRAVPNTIRFQTSKGV